MGRYMDWLQDNWCSSCECSHEESCAEYQEEQRYKRELAYKNKKELVDSIDTIEGLYDYINDLLISPFRNKETENDIKSILIRLIKDKNENDV